MVTVTVKRNGAQYAGRVRCRVKKHLSQTRHII